MKPESPCFTDPLLSVEHTIHFHTSHTPKYHPLHPKTHAVHSHAQEHSHVTRTRPRPLTHPSLPFLLLLLLTAVFEACCSALERLLRPLDDGYLDLNSEKEREPVSNYLYKNQTNSAAGDSYVFFLSFLFHYYDKISMVFSVILSRI